MKPKNCKDLVQRISNMLHAANIELVVHPNMFGKEYIFLKPKDSNNLDELVGLTEVKHI